MSAIVWLASYPKSGNTWARVFLANYWKGGDVPVDINKLADIDRSMMSSVRPIFDQTLGIYSADLSFDEIDMYRPAVYSYIATGANATVFFKTHDAYTYLPDGRPLISADVPCSVVYLVRNPFDVAVSYSNHNTHSIDDTIKLMADENHSIGSHKFGQRDQIRQQLLSWSHHVTSWLDAPDLPMLLVRYEDMVRDPTTAFTEMIRFVGDTHNPERFQKALEFSSFERLQRQEQERGFGEKMPLSPVFFRKGQVGSWGEVLTDQQVERIICDHSEVMQRLGYLTEDGQISELIKGHHV